MVKYVFQDIGLCFDVSAQFSFFLQIAVVFTHSQIEIKR
jgi:hypothetical protein